MPFPPYAMPQDDPEMPPPPGAMPLAPPPQGPYAAQMTPPPPAQGAPSPSAAMGATNTPPPQTEAHESFWRQLIPAVAPALLAGGGAAMMNRHGGRPGTGNDIGQIMAGIAGGFADERHRQGVEKRAQTFKQNEQMLETAHKAVMSLQGKDLSTYPNLAALVDKYKTAMASKESDGSYISPKEASEIVSMWVMTETQKEAKQEGMGSAREGAIAAARNTAEAGVQGATAEEAAWTGLPEGEARAKAGARRQQGLDAMAPVRLGDMGIEGLPSGAANLRMSAGEAGKFIFDRMTQEGIANRQNAQQAAQFSREMARMQMQFNQAQATQNSMGMRQIFKDGMDAAFKPDYNGDTMFPRTPEGEAAAKQFLHELFAGFATQLNPPPGAMQGGVTGITKVRK